LTTGFPKNSRVAEKKKREEKKEGEKKRARLDFPL